MEYFLIAKDYQKIYEWVQSHPEKGYGLDCIEKTLNKILLDLDIVYQDNRFIWAPHLVNNKDNTHDIVQAIKQESLLGFIHIPQAPLSPLLIKSNVSSSLIQYLSLYIKPLGEILSQSLVENFSVKLSGALSDLLIKKYYKPETQEEFQNIITTTQRLVQASDKYYQKTTIKMLTYLSINTQYFNKENVISLLGEFLNNNKAISSPAITHYDLLRFYWTHSELEHRFNEYPRLINFLNPPPNGMTRTGNELKINYEFDMNQIARSTICSVNQVKDNFQHLINAVQKELNELKPSIKNQWEYSYQFGSLEIDLTDTRVERYIMRLDLALGLVESECKDNKKLTSQQGFEIWTTLTMMDILERELPLKEEVVLVKKHKI